MFFKLDFCFMLPFNLEVFKYKILRWGFKYLSLKVMLKRKWLIYGFECKFHDLKFVLLLLSHIPLIHLKLEGIIKK